MLNIIKTAYCFYIVQLAINCESDYQLNKILDKVIDDNSLDQFVQGDKDIEKIFKYVIEYRKFNRCLIDEKPSISG